MSLKNLTADLHSQAESTKFMKRVLDSNIPLEIWNHYTLQRAFIYDTIESKSRSLDLIQTDSELNRSKLLLSDFISSGCSEIKLCDVTIEYQSYLESIDTEQRILAHMYTWHMGDMFGGQAIKKSVKDATHSALEFNDRSQCILMIRNLCEEWRVAETNEARVAFDYAIRLLETYDVVL